MSLPSRVRSEEATGMNTYMHIDCLPISLLAANNSRDQNEGVFRHKVPYTSFVLVAISGMRRKVEFQGVGKWKDCKAEERAEKGTKAGHVLKHCLESRKGSLTTS